MSINDIFKVTDSTEPTDTKHPINHEKDTLNYLSVNEGLVSDSEIKEDFAGIGKMIAEEMEEQDYHPVVIFGTSNAGKSTLLSSLFRYLKLDIPDKSISIRLGNPLIPTDTLYGKGVYNEAVTFFNKGVQEFINGTANLATKNKTPFFIPIIITPTDNSPEIKFAFMESNGEWYQPLKNNGEYAPELHPELQLEINAILRFFKNSISFIYLAPVTQVNTYTDSKEDSFINKEKIADASLAIEGVTKSYENLRIYRANDSHIFLVTKWDASMELKNLTPEKLRYITPAELALFTNKNYKQGLASFNMLNVNKSQKWHMQYCAGIMSQRNISENSDYKPVLNNYPRTLWNWLYGNATQYKSDIDKRLTLIPNPPKTKKYFFSSITDFFITFLK